MGGEFPGYNPEMLEKQLKSEQDLQVWEKAFGPAWWGYGTYQQFLLPGQDMSGTRARPEPAATAGPAAGPAKHTQGSQATDSPFTTKPHSHSAKGSETKDRQ